MTARMPVGGVGRDHRRWPWQLNRGMIRTTWAASWTHRPAITSGPWPRSRAAGSGRTGCGTSSRRSRGWDSARCPGDTRSSPLAEARAYLDHPLLGPRLVECAEAALGVEGRSAYEIFGSPDDMKLKSCATLFASVTPADSVFARLLDEYFQGERDGKTLQLLGTSTAPGD